MQRPLDEVLDSPAPAGVRIVAAGLLDEWLATLPRLHDEKDEEGLHDYRVALRKLRSWLRAFEEDGRKLREQLSELNEATGGARDAEVLVAWLKKDESPAATYVRDHLQTGTVVDLSWVEVRTGRVAERLTERLKRYSLEVPLGGVAAPVVPFSWSYAAALKRLHHELIEAALRVGSMEDPERLHKVRIRAKRLRYALLPLKDWPEAAEAIRLLKERQDLLGEHHDRHAFMMKLDALVGARPLPEIAQGLDALMVKARDEGRELFQQYSQHRHANDARLAELIEAIGERLGKRLGLHVEIIPQG